MGPGRAVTNTPSSVSTAARSTRRGVQPSGVPIPSSDELARRGAAVRVFISWSKEPSRSIAHLLAAWLPAVVQHVDAWMSDEEIKSGDRWSDAVARSLDGTNFGIICVTRANQAEPWLVFEAGALAKHLEMARVVPLCIDLDPSEVTGPLAAFQGRVLDEAGMRRIVQDVSGASEKPIPIEMVNKVFEAMWPQFHDDVGAAAEKGPGSEAPHRPPAEMLAELVDRVRRIERHMPRQEKLLKPGDMMTLSDGTVMMVPDDPTDIKALELYMSYWNSRLSRSNPTPGTVQARAVVGDATASTFRGTGSLGEPEDPRGGEPRPDEP